MELKEPCFLIFHQDSNGQLVHAHGRNKTYKSIQTSIKYGIKPFCETASITIETMRSAVVDATNWKGKPSRYYIVDVADDAALKANRARSLAEDT